MMNRLLVICLAILVPGVCPAGETEPATGVERPKGKLEITAALVEEDLFLRPIPRFRFLVFELTGDLSTSHIAEVMTGFDGKGSVELPVGRYRLLSGAELEVDGVAHAWDLPFEIQPGRTTSLEISNDNATARAEGTGGADQARVHERGRRAVFQVEADAHVGTGFLVDSSGLVLTTHALAGKADYLGVRVSRARKVPAERLATDVERDITVLRVNPEAVSDVPPLGLGSPLSPVEPPAAGQKVYLLGTSLRQPIFQTSGTVIRIESDHIVWDAKIAPGNTGRPAFDRLAQVVGMLTSKGPDRIMRIHLAQPALAVARDRAAKSDPPPATSLPVASERPYPIRLLTRVSRENRDPDDYRADGGHFEVQAVSPPLLYRFARESRSAGRPVRGSRKEKADRGRWIERRLWRDEMGDYRPVVFLGAMPRRGRPGGAFRSMRLLRDGKDVVPIVPGRVCPEEGGDCLGLYQYPPEAFAPGSRLELFVSGADPADAPQGITLGRIASRVWSDFEPYRMDAARPAPASTPVHLTREIQEPRRTFFARPHYSDQARSARAQGSVVLEVIVDPEGNVTEPRVLKSDPMFDEAAIEAVSRWKYRPAMRDGKPIAVYLMVIVEFNLK